jgi:hypothetical protein
MHFACLPSMAAKCFATSCLLPDPTVPSPDKTQSYNRYMFVSGNPISLIDVSGYSEEEGGTQGTTSETTGNGNKTDSDGVFHQNDDNSNSSTSPNNNYSNNNSSNAWDDFWNGVQDLVDSFTGGGSTSNPLTQPNINSPNTQPVKGPLERNDPRTMYNGLWDMLDGGGGGGPGGLGGPATGAGISFGIGAAIAKFFDGLTKPKKDEDKGITMYHYSKDNIPIKYGTDYLRENSYVTPVLYKSADEAIEKLALQHKYGTPLYVHKVKVKLTNVKLNNYSKNLVQVRPTPHKGVPGYPSRAGGGLEFITKKPTRILNVDYLD